MKGGRLLRGACSSKYTLASLNLAFPGFPVRQLGVGQCFPKFYDMLTVIRKKGVVWSDKCEKLQETKLTRFLYFRVSQRLYHGRIFTFS